MHAKPCGTPSPLTMPPNVPKSCRTGTTTTVSRCLGGLAGGDKNGEKQNSSEQRKKRTSRRFFGKSIRTKTRWDPESCHQTLRARSELRSAGPGPVSGKGFDGDDGGRKIDQA